MAAPRISVIVPACDSEVTIESSLGSLLAQTCRDLEVVVVDDGSTDGTATIVARVAAAAAVPVRLVGREHGGRAAARDTGVAEAAGGFLGFVDADDTAEPTMFERLLACADATGADLVVCEYVGVDAGTDEVLWRYPEGDARLYGGGVIEHPGLLSAIAGSVCNKLFARGLFADGGIEFPPGRDFEDLATVYRLMGDARRIEKVAEPLYRYRLGQPSSVMGACDERYLEILDALTITNDHFMARGTFEALRTDLEVVNFTHLIGGRIPDLLRFGRANVRHEYIARAFTHMDRYFPGWRRDDAVRSASGRAARHRVSTSPVLLRLYSDLKAVGAR